MPKLRFKATKDHPSWRHQKGGVVIGSYAGKPTLKIQSTIVVKDGEEVDMDDFEAQWCLACMPGNWLQATPKVKAKTIKDEESVKTKIDLEV